MPLRRVLGRLVGKGGREPGRGRSKAGRAVELNAAISELWQAEGTHGRDAFEKAIVPIYTALLAEWQRSLPAQEGEARLLALLQATTAACHYRWSLRLPLKRPGSDYRKYEIVYTYALITAMAVDGLVDQSSEENPSPEALASRILPGEGLARLREDPVVWQDWLGYFEQSDIGGLYAASICDKNWLKPKPASSAHHGAETPDQAPAIQQVEQYDARTVNSSEQPAGSGRAVLAALREGLSDGSLSFNQPSDAVQVDRDGRTFLEYPAVLEWCMERLALDEDLKRIKNRFDRLKVYKRTPAGRQLFRGNLRQRDPRVRGYVLEDHSVLWSEPPPAGRFVIENLTSLD